MPPPLQLQKLPGIEGGKKASLCYFRADKNTAEDCKFMGKNVFMGASYSTSNKLLLVARHILTTGLQKCLKLAV